MSVCSRLGWSELLLYKHDDKDNAADYDGPGEQMHRFASLALLPLNPIETMCSSGPTPPQTQKQRVAKTWKPVFTLSIVAEVTKSFVSMIPLEFFNRPKIKANPPPR